jgi:hypothetical protein
MGGQRAKIKNYSHDNLLKETELNPLVTIKVFSSFFY